MQYPMFVRNFEFGYTQILLIWEFTVLLKNLDLYSEALKFQTRLISMVQSLSESETE